LPKSVCRSPSSVAGRWVFPASALALVRYRTGLRGIPSAVVEGCDQSRIFAVPLRLRLSGPTLRWVSLPPLRRHPLARPLPVALASFLRSLGSHLGFSFRPRGFSPPRRLSPRNSRGLVASRCRSWGSPRFLSAGSERSEDRLEHRRTFPAAPTPLEELPSPAAVPCLHGRCPLAVPRCRSPRLASPPLPECTVYHGSRQSRRPRGLAPLGSP
jgi:hypothetical protein